MLLSRETSGANIVSAWSAEGIRVGDEWFSGHVIISAQAIIRDWSVTNPQSVEVEDLARAVDLAPKVLLLGTGAGLVLPNANLMQSLGERGIGLEIMDTPAACRTYNVLVQENREVVAALFSVGLRSAP
jgi:uncharacterized protein